MPGTISLNKISFYPDLDYSADYFKEPNFKAREQPYQGVKFPYTHYFKYSKLSNEQINQADMFTCIISSEFGKYKLSTKASLINFPKIFHSYKVSNLHVLAANDLFSIITSFCIKLVMIYHVYKNLSLKFPASCSEIIVSLQLSQSINNANY